MAEELPFLAFLEILRGDGIELGLDEYQAMGRLLARWHGTDLEALGAAVAGLLARNQEEHTRIRELFTTFCASQEATQPLPPPPPPPVPKPVPELRSSLSSEPPPRPAGRVRVWTARLLGILALFAGLFFGAKQLWDLSIQLPTSRSVDASSSLADAALPHPTDLGTPHDLAPPGKEPNPVGASKDAQPKAPPADPRSTPKAAPHKGQKPKPPPQAKDKRAPIDREPALSPWPTLPPATPAVQCPAPRRVSPMIPEPPLPPARLRSRLVSWVVGGSAGLVFLSLILRRLRVSRVQRSRRKLAELPGAAFYDLHLRDLPPPLSREEVDHLATLFDRLRFAGAASPAIDVPRSLLRCLRVELPMVVFQQTQIRGSLVLFRDLSLTLRPWTRLLDSLVLGLRARGIIVHCYYFSDCPDWLSERPGGLPVAIEDLLPLGLEGVLLVAGAPPLSKDRKDPQGPDWLQTLAQFPRRLWLAPPPNSTPQKDLIRLTGVPLFPLSYRGLHEAARALLTGDENVRTAAALPSAPTITAEHLSRFQALIELAPHATPELAALLRQRYAPDVPEEAVVALVSHSRDLSGELLDFSTDSMAVPEAALSPHMAVRNALVRTYLLQVWEDSQPAHWRSLAHLRWRLDRALLALQIPDPRKVLHPQAQAELAALLRTPLFEEVAATAAQKVNAGTLAAARLPTALKRQVRAAQASPLRFAGLALLATIGPLLLGGGILGGLSRSGLLYTKPVVHRDALALTLTVEPHHFKEPLWLLSTSGSSYFPIDYHLLNDPIVPVARVSPDGRTLTALSAGGVLERWSVTDARVGFPRAPASRLFELGPIVREFKAHAASIRSATYSPDGLRIVTANSDRTARVWDVNSGAQLVELRGHIGSVNSAAYSPDGQRIVTASDDQTARVWGAANGRLLAELKGHTGVVYSANYSPDGRHIVTASDDQTARVWDADSRRLQVELTGHRGVVHSATYSPDGLRIVTASGDANLRVWDAATGRLLDELKGHGAMYSAMYSPDGRHIVTASADGKARIWEVDTWRQRIDLEGHEGIVYSAAYSPDGQRIVTASNDKTARLWKAEDGHQLAELRGPEFGVTSAMFSSDGGHVLTAAPYAAAVWNPTGAGAPPTIRSWAESPRGGRSAVVYRDDIVRVWEDSAKDWTRALVGHRERIESVSFSPDGRRILTSSLDATARIWDAESGKQLLSLEGHLAGLNYAGYSSDGSRVLTASEDATVQLWDAATGEKLQRFYVDDAGVWLARLSPDGGQMLAVARKSRSVQLFSIQDGYNPIRLTGHGDEVQTAAFAPDGRALLTTAKDGTARLWEAATGRLLTTMRVPCGTIPTAIFSPDGRFVALGDSAGKVRIFATDGRLVADDLTDHEGAVTALVFSTDGQLLLSSAMDHTLLLHDLSRRRTTAMVQNTGRSLVASPAAAVASLAELSLVSDASAPAAISQLSREPRAKDLGFPLPTPDRPHRYLAVGRNEEEQLLLSRPIEVQAVAPACSNQTCPFPAGEAWLTLRRSPLLYSIPLSEDVETVPKPTAADLNAIARLLKWRLDIKGIGIQVHAEKGGTASSARKQTERLAASTVAYLIGQGIEPARLASAGFGFACPRAVGDFNVSGDRRVDIYILLQNGRTLPPPRCGLGTMKLPAHVEIKGQKLNLSAPLLFISTKRKIALDPKSFPILDQVASLLTEQPDIKLRIEGHTDDRGTAQSKLDLSTQRAQAALDYLVHKGVNTERLTREGLGDRCPLVPNVLPADRAQNNRLDFSISERRGVKFEPPKCQPLPTGCNCKGASCACTPGVNCPCTPGVNCRCTPGVDCPCTSGKDCACEEGKTCACTPGVDCPCTPGVDCLCTPGKDCPKKAMRIKSVLPFDYDSPERNPEAEQIVRNEIGKLVEHLKQGGKIRVEGHGDNVGGMEYSTRLTQGRAESISNLIVSELKARGVSDEIIANQILPPQGYSYQCPAVPYSKRFSRKDQKLRDEENEPNRRVEINMFPEDGIKCYFPPSVEE